MWIAWTAVAHAQVPVRPEATTLAQGWSQLAKGDAAGAAVSATQELGRDQHSAAALVLLIDAELARGGVAGGLSAYEKWLGSRALENAHVLRRVARAALVELSGRQPSPRVALEALLGLAADGDQAASAKLERASLANGFGETRALASMGSERAISRLIVQLKSMPGNRAQMIETLAESRSRLAVPPLQGLLGDPNEVNRAAAAAGLGQLEAAEAIPQLRPLMQDPNFTVRLKAAGALVRLGDTTGLAWLIELTASEHAAIRMAAARELAVQPDGAWQNLVRSLTTDPDPMVRMDAARLIAPYDQPLASSVLQALLRDDNLAVREAASSVLVERVASDFATLRGLLRAGDPLVRVRAADRILELTR